MHSVHEQHRDRLRARFCAEGLASFEDHQVLEAILFYALPRVDTNEIAHRLLNRFGSVRTVFAASYEALAEIPGLGKDSALLFSLIREVSRTYLGADVTPVYTVSSVREACQCFLTHFDYRTEEHSVAIFLNHHLRALGSAVFPPISDMGTDLSMNELVRAASAHEADVVLLGHNHPSADAHPSDADVVLSDKIAGLLAPLHILLLDHIVCVDGRCGSLSSRIKISDEDRARYAFYFSSSCEDLPELPLFPER